MITSLQKEKLKSNRVSIDALKKKGAGLIKQESGTDHPTPTCFSLAFSDQVFECQHCVLKSLCQEAAEVRDYVTLTPEIDFETSLRSCHLLDYCYQTWWSYPTLRKKMLSLKLKNSSWFVNELIGSTHTEHKLVGEEMYYKFVF